MKHSFFSTTSICLLVCLAAMTGLTAADQGPPPETVAWLDVAGKPLPFQSPAEITDALLGAEVKSRSKPKNDGLEGYEMLMLEHQGAQFYALFRSADNQSAMEMAAYELDRLLGLDMVPPTVERSIGDSPGAVQIWRGHAVTERDLDESGQLIPPNPTDFKQQGQSMLLFDKLIANSTRGPKTVLIDPSWKIWLVAHADAFEATSDLGNLIELTKCNRAVWERLKELDKTTAKEALEPYLDKKQLTKFISRQRKLIRHIQGMLNDFGEEFVLF